MRQIAAGQGFYDAKFATLLDFYTSMDTDGDGTVSREEMLSMLRKSSTGVMSDTDLMMLGAWLDGALVSSLGSRNVVDFIEFCRLMRQLESYPLKTGGSEAFLRAASMFKTSSSSEGGSVQDAKRAE